MNRESRQTVEISDRLIRRLRDVLDVKRDNVLSAFVRAAERTNQAPRASAQHIVELLNDMFWQVAGLRQGEKQLIKDCHDDLKEEMNRSPRKPKKRQDGKALTLEEIKRRQEQRRRAFLSMKTPLIRLGEEEPQLRQHLKQILDAILDG